MEFFRIQPNPHLLTQNQVDFNFVSSGARKQIDQLLSHMNATQLPALPHNLQQNSPDTSSDDFSESDHCLECKYCGKMFERLKVFERHMKMHDPNYTPSSRTGGSQQKPRRPRKYPIFPLPAQESARTPFFCQFCGSFQETMEDLDTHVCEIQRQTNYICPLCRQMLLSVDQLIRHVRAHPDMRYACSMCRDVFQSRRQWKYHMQNHGLMKPQAALRRAGHDGDSQGRPQRAYQQ